VQAPRALGKSTLLPIHVWRTLSTPYPHDNTERPSDRAYLVIYVTDRHEAESVGEMTRGEMEDVPADVGRLVICSYGDFLAILRRNSMTSTDSGSHE
jgi:hypothetical protein